VRLNREQSRERIVAAATKLVRTRSFPELSVEEVMAEAGQGRTIFYRHFDDLADLLTRASRDAIVEMLGAQEKLAKTRAGDSAEIVREAIEPAVDAYYRHGPLLRAMSEAAAGDEQIAGWHDALFARFDELVVATLGGMESVADAPPADIKETAHALNLLNESYLLEAFGRKPRVSKETAVETLTEIWTAVIHRNQGD
jgi:TetR/AcrR family transcriptional regulator, ethionamide resistance regulator